MFLVSVFPSCYLTWLYGLFAFLFSFSDSHFIATFGGHTAYHVDVLDFKIDAGGWESGRSFDSPRLG